MNSSSKTIKTSLFIHICVEFYTFIKKITQFYEIPIIITLLRKISNFAHFFSDIEKIQINIPKTLQMSPNIDWCDQNILLLKILNILKWADPQKYNENLG